MSCRVICISGTEGAGAADVAEAAAALLGFRVVDEEIVARAAREAGVDPGVVADVERRRSFIARLLDDLGPTSTLATAGFTGVLPSADDLSSDDLRALVRAAVEETAAVGDVVILAHASSFALTGRDDALRVLVTASTERRRQRVVEARSLDARDAEKVVEDADAARADYLRRFYDVRTELPTHYDLVVNTDQLDPERAAEVVVRASG
jgi:cytidylate kinase